MCKKREKLKQFTVEGQIGDNIYQCGRVEQCMMCCELVGTGYQ
jgi:hypothetical protein